jgi:LPXTG-motif cell wall-anchored protein
MSLVFINAVPELPMIISGNVSINNNPAKVGTKITAFVNEVKTSEIKTTYSGKFFILLQKLNEGDEIRLYVDGIDTKESISYKSGDFRQLTLKVEKSYVIYYASGTLILLALAGFIIWRKKRKR